MPGGDGEDRTASSRGDSDDRVASPASRRGAPRRPLPATSRRSLVAVLIVAAVLAVALIIVISGGRVPQGPPVPLGPRGPFQLGPRATSGGITDAPAIWAFRR